MGHSMRAALVFFLAAPLLVFGPFLDSVARDLGHY